MILLDATADVWERRWFVLRRCVPIVWPRSNGTHAVLERPYLHVYKHSNELEEIAVISLDGVNVENNSDMSTLLGVRCLFSSSPAPLRYAYADATFF